MFHGDDEHEIREPAVLHAFYLLGDCSANRYEADSAALDEARELARMQIQNGGRQFNLRHWLRVYAVLNCEVKARC